MFIKDEIQTRIRNTAGLTQKLMAAYPNGYNIAHDSTFGKRLLGEEHLDTLSALAEALGFGFGDTVYTYTVKVYQKAGKTEVKVYQPRLALRRGTCMLQWGEVYKPLSDLANNKNIIVQPQIVKNEKYTNYSVVLATELGDVPFAIYPKDGVELTTVKFTKLIETGIGWKEVLESPYPVDVKTLVHATSPVFEFTAVGYRTESKSGTTKDGRPFTIDSIVLETEEGELYSAKDGKSRNAKDIRYWGEQCSLDNPIHFVIQFEGTGDYNGKPYTQWGVTATPVNQEESSLADLLELAEAMDEENLEEQFRDKQLRDLDNIEF